PLAAGAQQPAMPVIGYIDSLTPEMGANSLLLFRKALGEAGYVEGRNIAVLYRWADGQFDRLPALAADLVRQRVAVIVAVAADIALAAKTATTTIPIVFASANDPVRLGVVASLARPGGNITGVSYLAHDVRSKRFE